MGHVSTEQLHAMAPATVPIVVWIRRAQLRWLGHLARREDDYPPKCVLFSHHMLHAGRRPRGRPPASQQQNLNDFVKELMRPGGAIHHVVDVALKFGVLFKDLQGRTLQHRRQISWANVAMNRVLWSRVVELGAILNRG